MYNDYYLQEISGKISTTNSKLIDIIENQETLISGDKDIIERINVVESHIIATNLILILAIIYTFIRGCFRC